MDQNFKMECQRHKLIGNKKYVLQITSQNIMLTNMCKSQTHCHNFFIDYELHIDFKQKNGLLKAIGFITKKHHWYYSDQENLQMVRNILGGRVIFKGINDLYQPMQQIGQGTFSNVYLLQDKLNITDHYACKCLDKAQVEKSVGKDGLYEELKAMVKLKHKNIGELIEFFEGEVSYYIVMEYYNLEFTDVLKDLQIEDTHIILKQLVTAVNYMHQNGYMHRDIKPENIMFNETIYELKLIDFGLTTKENGKVKCGTAGYVAPEILNLDPYEGTYDEKCDVFSIGAIFYKMLSQHDLFTGTEHDEILRNNAKFQFSLEILKGNPKINKKTLNLLQQMLELDPKKRIDTKSILQHEYFKEEEEAHKNIGTPETLSLRKKSSIIKQLSPLQKMPHKSPFTINDEEITIEIEAVMQPMPCVVMKGGSYSHNPNNNIPLQQQKQKMKFTQDNARKFQTSDFEEVIKETKYSNYRPPKPSQLQEIYHK